MACRGCWGGSEPEQPAWAHGGGLSLVFQEELAWLPASPSGPSGRPVCHQEHNPCVSVFSVSWEEYASDCPDPSRLHAPEPALHWSQHRHCVAFFGHLETCGRGYTWV